MDHRRPSAGDGGRLDSGDATSLGGRRGRRRVAATSGTQLLLPRLRYQESSRANLLDYYAFLGDTAQFIADGAARGEDQVKATAAAFEELGIDELIFDPSVPRLDQVDLLADVVF